ncbi:hypothetical protein L7F22_040519 [Adiantum nelumboides]|nr:hypothetical protein [Adiantum nelumboides]
MPNVQQHFEAENSADNQQEGAENQPNEVAIDAPQVVEQKDAQNQPFNAMQPAEQPADFEDMQAENPLAMDHWVHRSTRETRSPDRYVSSMDYVMLTDCGEANGRTNNEKWYKAMLFEMDSLEKNHTWDLVDLPKGAKALPCKWVYKKKVTSDASSKYKASLVAKGYKQEHGVDFDEIFSPGVKLTTLRMVLGLVAALDMELTNGCYDDRSIDVVVMLKEQLNEVSKGIVLALKPLTAQLRRTPSAAESEITPRNESFKNKLVKSFMDVEGLVAEIPCYVIGLLLPSFEDSIWIGQLGYLLGIPLTRRAHSLFLKGIRSWKDVYFNHTWLSATQIQELYHTSTVATLWMENWIHKFLDFCTINPRKYQLANSLAKLTSAIFSEFKQVHSVDLQLTHTLNSRWKTDWSYHQWTYEFKAIGAFPIQIKHCVLLWLIIHNEVWTGAKSNKIRNTNDLCCRCGREEETLEHLFLNCRSNKIQLKILQSIISPIHPLPISKDELLLGTSLHTDICLWNQARALYLWHTWVDRLKSLFSSSSLPYPLFRFELKRLPQVASKEMKTVSEFSQHDIQRNSPWTKWRSALLAIYSSVSYVKEQLNEVSKGILLALKPLTAQLRRIPLAAESEITPRIESFKKELVKSFMDVEGLVAEIPCYVTGLMLPSFEGYVGIESQVTAKQIVVADAREPS